MFTAWSFPSPSQSNFLLQSQRRKEVEFEHPMDNLMGKPLHADIHFLMCSVPYIFQK